MIFLHPYTYKLMTEMSAMIVKKLAAACGAAMILSAYTSFSLHAEVSGESLSCTVNTLIGTEGAGLVAGFVYPGATRPFGMVQFTPTYFARRGGFVINQLSGAGCRHMGNFPTLPVKGGVDGSPSELFGNRVSISSEKGHAGYYQAEVDGGILAELSVTPRTGMARYVFPEDCPDGKGTIIIGAGISATPISQAAVCITGPSSCEGYAEGGNFCGVRTPYKVYFVAEFDAEALETGVWKGDRLLREASFAEGESSGVYFTFDTRGGGKIQYKIGVSYVSVENARENLRAENPGWSFDSVRESAEGAWDKYLGKIEVHGTDPLRKVQFYTHLYHALIHPNICSDVNGEYMGADFKVHRSRDVHYTSFSNWDTYRTQIQLLAMLDPDVASAVVRSHRDFAEQSGGALPRWVMANIETGIMQGDPTPALIANAWAFGARDYDPLPVFGLMKNNAEIPGLKSQDIEERPGLQQYKDKGWWNASEHLEYSTSDFAIGKFALYACGDEFADWHYSGRAQQWKNLYNPETGWLQSRNADGSWKSLGEDWRESTYPNYFWMVPFNIAGLIDIIGGPEIAEKRLDELFRRLDANYVQDWYACGNEPSFQIPWIYDWVGRPDKTSEVVNRIINDHYSAAPDGLPGNDDLGTMGAWYVFACMGMYPMIPGIGGFALNTPIFEKITVHLENGNLVIAGGSETRIYTTGLKIDGKPHAKAWISWEDVCNGAVVEYTTSTRPSGNWGREQLPPSFGN